MSVRAAAGAVAGLGIGAALLCASASHAGTTRYYYDPVGRLLGAMQSQALDRAEKVDAADNATYLHVLPTLAPTGVDTLGSGGVLIADQTLTSADGRFTLTLQEDGNLVIYQNSNSSALWSSNTHGDQPGYLIMQSAGNLVLYGPDDTALWYNSTSGQANSRLIMQTDGNLVIYSGASAVWSTGTGGH